MLNFIVLFKTPDSAPLDKPHGFQCWAEDAAHASEQCMDAEPDCEIVWHWEGAFGTGIDAALNSYTA
jgi:hypothetical protein